MLFNSFTYVVFLLVVVSIYWLIPNKWQNIFILVSSYFFYGYWKIEGLFLLLGFSLVNWFLAHLVDRFTGRKKNILLIISIVINLIILCYFKYFKFILENVFLLVFNNTWEPVDIKIILPLDISFFVFEAISFLVDTYKRGIKITNFHNFALYISFFPHLIAGPIVRIEQFEPQLNSKKIFNWNFFFS